jgi:hypothetical protein
MRQHPWAGCLIALILMASGVVVFALALRSNRMSLPETTIDLGVARIMLNTVRIPLCPQQVPCVSGSPRPINRISSGWLVFSTPVGNAPHMVKLFGIVQTDVEP